MWHRILSIFVRPLYLQELLIYYSFLIFRQHHYSSRDVHRESDVCQIRVNLLIQRMIALLRLRCFTLQLVSYLYNGIMGKREINCFSASPHRRFACRACRDLGPEAVALRFCLPFF